VRAARVTHARDVRFPGKVNATFAVENRGSGSCAIGAFPTVTFTRDGAAVPATLTTDSTGRGTRRLGPGNRADFQLIWRTSGGCGEEAVADGLVIGLAPDTPPMPVPAVDADTGGSRTIAIGGGVVVTDFVTTP
jgi:hypothetical protein